MMVAGDFISRWCTEHKLSEHTAQILRHEGFTTKEAVESMRVHDLDHLKINTAQKCMLREAISPKISQSESQGTSRIAYMLQ